MCAEISGLFSMALTISIRAVTSSNMRSDSVIMSPEARTKARCTTFSNSRTLPGHGYCMSNSIASDVNCMVRSAGP